MRATHNPTGPLLDTESDDGIVDLDLSPEGTADTSAAAVDPTRTAAGEDFVASSFRSRLSAVVGFLAVFQLLFAVIKLTGPSSAVVSASDVPAWSLLVRFVVDSLLFALLRSPIHLTRRHLLWIEGFVFVYEMMFMLLMQYMSAVDLIDRGDLVDAVAVQKNGVLRVTLLMICYGIFMPRRPATTAKVVTTMATSLMLCHGIVLHHAETLHLDRDDLANHQIVMANALFLIMGAALATLAAWWLRGAGADGDGDAAIGPYRLLRKLDEGSRGAVYLAEHEFLKRPCALKLARPGGPDVAARFDREVQAAARISHPNLVTIFDSGRTDDGTMFCAMEYLPGLCVADIVRDSGPMPAARAVYLGRQICAALAEIHRLGFVHRDLNPANVLVSSLAGQGDVAKVLDLGSVGGDAAGTDHDPGAIAGTPEYVAPEQAVAGRRIDGRADVYGLGALLHFMVTGAPPFQHDTPTDVLRAHVSEAVRPPRERAADLPHDLEAVILRCLAKRPQDRYADCRAVAEALSACVCATAWDGDRADRWWQDRHTQATLSETAPV